MGPVRFVWCELKCLAMTRNYDVVTDVVVGKDGVFNCGKSAGGGRDTR